MRSAKRSLLLLHLGALGCALSFALLALLLRKLFPNGYFDCLMGDVLHLYCPFCGGTRAFLALLSLDLRRAWLLNSGVILAALVALVLDVRAILLVCRGCERGLVPRWGYPAAILYFVAWALLRNTLMLWGIDPAGDHAAYWVGLPALNKVLFVPIAALMCAALLYALMPTRLTKRRKAIALFAGLVLLVSLAILLYRRWYLAFAYLAPLCVLFSQFMPNKGER